MELGSPINKDSLENLVKSIFQGKPTVYEAYSVNDNEVRRLYTSTEVMEYINEVKNKKKKLVYLSIHYPETGGFINIEKITLNPEKSNGAKFRYHVGGWGLIHFQLWINENSITCDLRVCSEKRALKFESISLELKSPELWDWKEVQRQYRRLKCVLKKS